MGPDGTASTYYTASGQDLWSGHDGDRYIKYEATLSTSDPSQTPELQEVRITYQTPSSTTLNAGATAAAAGVTALVLLGLGGAAGLWTRRRSKER